MQLCPLVDGEWSEGGQKSFEVFLDSIILTTQIKVVAVLLNTCCFFSRLFVSAHPLKKTRIAWKKCCKEIMDVWFHAPDFMLTLIGLMRV